MKFKIDVCVEVLLNFENVDSGADFSTFQKLYYNYSIRKGIGQATEKNSKYH
jgi:hypothetical protein